MAMVTGLATVIALLKTQGVMMQFSYASVGPRTARKLGGQFMTGVSYMTGKGRAVTSRTSGAIQARAVTGTEKRAIRTGTPQTIHYTSKKTGAAVTHTAKPKGAKTGTTTEAPKRKEQELKPPKVMEK
jgi:hypothetical protein